MEALQLPTRRRLHPYACQSIEVRPNPPRVGVPTTLALALTNPGPEPLTVKQITFHIAVFGMGMRWEELPPLGPFQVPADSTHSEVVQQEWTPATAGHRCVQASIYLERAPNPIRVRRNLDVIQSGADRSTWQVPFALGNPEEEPLPLTLRLGQDAQMRAVLMVADRVVQPGEPIWLNPHEEAEGLLLLEALTAGALASENTVEAFLGGHFLDGIQVVVQRAASRQSLPGDDFPELVGVAREALVVAR